MYLWFVLLFPVVCCFVRNHSKSQWLKTTNIYFFLVDVQVSCNSTKVGWILAFRFQVLSLQAQGCSSGSGVLHVSLILSGPSGFLCHVAQDEWMAGTQEDKWKHMTPFEPFIVGLACYHVYITLDNTESIMAKPRVNNVGKCTLFIIVGVTVKSPGKGNGYIHLIQGGQEKLRMTTYYTTVHSLVYFVYPSHMQNKLFHKTWQSFIHLWHLRPHIKFEFGSFGLGICEFKNKWFPLNRLACSDRAGVG